MESISQNKYRNVSTFRTPLCAKAPPPARYHPGEVCKAESNDPRAAMKSPLYQWPQ